MKIKNEKGEVINLKPLFGNHCSHAENKVRRKWKHNIQTKRILIDNKLIKVVLPVRWIKTLLYKKEKNYTFEEFKMLINKLKNFKKKK